MQAVTLAVRLRRLTLQHLRCARSISKCTSVWLPACNTLRKSEMSDTRKPPKSRKPVISDERALRGVVQAGSGGQQRGAG
jgi:hypothetical protein